MQKFVKRSRIGIFRNKHTRSTPLDPKLRFWVFRTICVHSGPFGCLTKLGAKWTELVQKFLPRSRIGIFHNERTQFTPLDSKMTFWCVLYYLGAFGTVWLLTKLGAKWAEVVQKFVPRSRVGIIGNERTRSTPLDPKLTFRCVSYNLDLRPFGCLPTLGAKRPELVQKFVPQSCVRIFRNERTRSTPLDPKLTFWCISYYLGAFGTIWLPYETRCKTGRTSAKVHPTKSRRIFFTTNAPDPPHQTLN